MPPKLSFFFPAFSVKVLQCALSESFKREKKRIVLEDNVENVEINFFSLVLSAQMKERGSSKP